jgi:hypothetical protein
MPTTLTQTQIVFEIHSTSEDNERGIAGRRKLAAGGWQGGAVRR